MTRGIEEALEGFACRLRDFHVDTRSRTSEQRDQPTDPQDKTILSEKRLEDSRRQPTLRTPEKLGSERPSGFITPRAEVMVRYTS